jgi:ABC-type amino acid transport substrate-binding protein
MILRSLSAALVAAVLALPALAQPADTLRKIAETRSITLGHRADAIPFSYLDDRGQPTGYSVDLCKAVAASIETMLNVGPLEVRWVSVTPESRIGQVVRGGIDLECGVTTVTLGRLAQVDFSSLIFVEGGSLLVRAEGGPQRLADLAGRTIGVLPGTTTETRLREALKARQIDARVVNVGDERAGATAVMEGRIDAFAGDRVVLLGVGLRAGGGTVLALMQEDFSLEPYALMMRRGDPNFRLAVNRALAHLYSGQGIADIYERWFATLGRPGPLLTSMYLLNAFTE